MRMRRKLFTPEHDDFRRSVRGFLAREAVPHTGTWESQGMVDRDFWRRAAAQGLVGFAAPERLGGAGIDDFRFNAILDEEVAYAGVAGDGFALENDIIAPYLLDLATPSQQERWLPGLAAGDLVFAIAMSEPGAGSDLRAMTTTALRTPGGYLLSGSKTFVTSGIQAELVIVAARVEDGFSLLVVEEGMEGFERGRKLEKVGRHAQDTAELFFDRVDVPEENLLGEDGKGLDLLKRHLPQERLSIAVTAIASAEAGLALTLAHCRERHAFGRPLGKLQAVRFALAGMHTSVTAGRAFVDRCIEAHVEGELTGPEAAGAKAWATDLQFQVLDQCMQLHGGYGYMEEYPIARMWRDGRVQRIYGGANEVMQDIVGRSLGL
jgi:acyl-CoA dehydrogenase